MVGGRRNFAFPETLKMKRQSSVVPERTAGDGVKRRTLKIETRGLDRCGKTRELGTATDLAAV
jgi:hypothetical protein